MVKLYGSRSTFTQMIKNIIIVGGGFGGWYTSAFLRHNFPNIDVTVIDSDKHPRLGVGETLGWSAPYDWAKNLGIKDDNMLMWRTGAIYKYGINVRDFWSDHSSFSYGKFFNLKIKSLAKFYGEFDYPEFYEPWSKQPGDVGIQQAWLAINQHTKKDFTDYINEVNEASYFIKNPVAPNDALNRYVLRPSEGWSYHIDAEQMVSFLKDLTFDNNPNVKHISSAVTNINYNNDGSVQSITLENNDVLSADIYIDASGFSRVLMKNNSTWKDMGDDFCNSAWVCPTKYTDPATEITGGTDIHGEDYGWRFKVKLYHRAGNGYVFNSNQVDKQTPLTRLLEVTEGQRLVEPRLIKWVPGYYETPWEHNVIGVGVASNFVDPYDAPTFDIHSRALEDLKTALNQQTLTEAQEKYNSSQKLVAEERYLRLMFNFVLSSRRGPFWDSRRDLVIKHNLTEKLQDIINDNRADIDSRLSYFWYQMYYRMIIASGTDRTQFKTVELTSADREMAEAFFKYNKSRNAYIETQSWPNYYEWLKTNRFNGRTSEEMLAKFHPQWANK